MNTVSARLVFALVVCFGTIAGEGFYNPDTGRWLSRDPIGEAGGLNLMGFVQNEPVGRIDFLGLDYYIVITRGKSGKSHRTLIGDDGNGNSFQVEFYPDVNNLIQECRRVCGKAVIDYRPRNGSATNLLEAYLESGGKLEKHVETSDEEDKWMVLRATYYGGQQTTTYCLLINDCRAIERNVKRCMEKKWYEKVWDSLDRALDEFTDPGNWKH